MLPAVLLFATLFAPGPTIVAEQRQACPATPASAFGQLDRPCAGLEVSGRIDPNGVSLEPAFSVLARPGTFARPAPGSAVLDGYSADGRLLFDFPFSAEGSFKLLLPLAPQFADDLVRLTLTANGATYVQDAATPAVPSGDAISVDDGYLLFIWNAHQFPAVRLAAAQYGEPIATLRGAETYQQIGVRTNARRLIVSFSNGVRSVDRTVAVFGR